MAVATLQSSQPLPADHRDFQQPVNSYADVAANGTGDSFPDEKGAAEVYSGHGEDVTTTSPQRNAHTRPKPAQMNGSAKDDQNTKIVVERYVDREGEHLVSLGTIDDDEGKKQLAIRRRDSELLSGRRAGARWDRRGYAIHSFTHCMCDTHSSIVSDLHPFQFL